MRNAENTVLTDDNFSTIPFDLMISSLSSKLTLVNPFGGLKVILASVVEAIALPLSFSNGLSVVALLVLFASVTTTYD